MVKNIDGRVVYNRYLIWLNKSHSAMAEAKFVVSLRGDNLSPKYAPDMTAPAVISGLIPIACPIPISAIPIVADVDQLLPVTRDVKAARITAVGKNIVGFIIFNP